MKNAVWRAVYTIGVVAGTMMALVSMMFIKIDTGIVLNCFYLNEI